MCGGSSEWKALLQALPLWSSLSDFVLKAKIEDGEDYLQQVDNFETQVKQLYLYGRILFSLTGMVQLEEQKALTCIS